MNADRIPELPTELKPLEADLAALAPAAGNLGRDELMYRAGWEACAADGQVPSIDGGSPRAAMFDRDGRSVKTHAPAWLWPLSTAGLLLITATLAVLLATRGEPEVRVVYVEKRTDSAIVPPGADNVATNETQQSERSLQNDSPSQRVAARDRAPSVRRLGDDYLSLRERVLAFGVEVLPTHTPAASPVPSESGRDMRYGSMIGRFIGS
jgi:hypothetical protein